MQISVEKNRIPWLIFWVVIGFLLVFSIAISFQNAYVGKKLLFYSVLFIFINVLLLVSYLVIIGIVVFIIFFMLINEEFLEDCLVILIRKHQRFFLWTTFITFLVFLTLLINIIFFIFINPPETAISFIKDNGLVLIFSLEALVMELLLVIKLAVTKPPKLSSPLAEKVTPENIVRNPQAAIEESFKFFENRLRERLKDHDKPIRDLIYKHFDEDKGDLAHLNISKNQQRGMKELIAGIYAYYRNPLMHGQLNFSKRDDREMIITLLTLLDKFVQFLDESEPGHDSETLS